MPIITARARTKTAANAAPKATKSTPKSEKLSLSDMWARRKVPLIGAGLLVAVMTAYVTQLALSYKKAASNSGSHRNEVPTGRSRDVRHGRISAMLFDQDLDRSEGLIGITKLRKLMGGLARGHVLEVAVGTGREIKYIDWDEVEAMSPRPHIEGVEDKMEPKPTDQLYRERVQRRLAKGKKGMILPGDEAPEVVSYTGVDISIDMLEVAWMRIKQAVPDLIPKRRRRHPEPGQEQSKDSGTEERHPAGSAMKLAAALTTKPDPQPSQSSAPKPDDDQERVLAVDIGSGRIRLYKADVQKSLPEPPTITGPDGRSIKPKATKYDTILQGFGLCSVKDPEKLLANMASVLQPGTGRIYLLEHGRGTWGFVNRIVDLFAAQHFERFGCWYNRDIEKIVRDAEKSVPGLEVVRLHRPLWTHAGTTLWVELKINPPRQAEAKGPEKVERRRPTGEGE